MNRGADGTAADQVRVGRSVRAVIGCIVGAGFPGIAAGITGMSRVGMAGNLMRMSLTGVMVVPVIVVMLNLDRQQRPDPVGKKNGDHHDDLERFPAQ